MGYSMAHSLAHARLGVKVESTARDLFSGALTSIFTVVGGRILLTHFQIVTSAFAMNAVNNNAWLTTNPTVGADMALCAVLDVVSAAIGSTFSITGLVTDAMTGPVAGGGAMAMNQPIIVPVGTIDIDGSADSAAGGCLGTAEMWYLPLDDGAYVTAV